MGEIEKRVKARVEKLLNTVTEENLAEVYAEHSNLILLKAYDTSNTEESKYLLEAKRVLEVFCAHIYMKERGFTMSVEGEYSLWEKVES